MYFRLSHCSVSDETLCFQDPAQLLTLVLLLVIFPSFHKMREVEMGIKNAWSHHSLGHLDLCASFRLPTRVLCPLAVVLQWTLPSEQSLPVKRDPWVVIPSVTFRTLPSICIVLGGSRVHFANLVPPSSAKPAEGEETNQGGNTEIMNCREAD